MTREPQKVGTSKPSTWHPITPPRQLTPWERGLIERILSAPMAKPIEVPGTPEIRRQLPSASVHEACSCCLSIGIRTDHDPAHQIPGGKSGYFKELYGTDSDGMTIWAILFTKDGYLAELEVQRAGGSRFAEMPGVERFLDPRPVGHKAV